MWKKERPLVSQKSKTQKEAGVSSESLSLNKGWKQTGIRMSKRKEDGEMKREVIHSSWFLSLTLPLLLKCNTHSVRQPLQGVMLDMLYPFLEQIFFCHKPFHVPRVVILRTWNKIALPNKHIHFFPAFFFVMVCNYCWKTFSSLKHHQRGVFKSFFFTCTIRFRKVWYGDIVFFSSCAQMQCMCFPSDVKQTVGSLKAAKSTSEVKISVFNKSLCPLPFWRHSFANNKRYKNSYQTFTISIRVSGLYLLWLFCTVKQVGI